MADPEELMTQADKSREFTSYEGVVETPATVEEENAPMYRVIGENRIPVSKHRGPLWKSRYDQAGTSMSKYRDAWNEAYRYYRNDHSRRGSQTDPNSADQGGGHFSAINNTENMVFANVSALVPMLYTKNPEAEFTVEDEEDQNLARMLQKLINTLAAKKTTPGLNLKRKTKRNIVSTVLTNLGWFEVGYVFREQSSEQTQEEIMKLSEELLNATSQDKIREVEGKLQALEMKVDMLSPPGPWVKVRRPDQIRFDTTSPELDLSDSNWAIVDDFMPTWLMRAMYGRKRDDGSDKWESVFEPTHVLQAGTATSNGDRAQTDTFQLFSYSDGDDGSNYGYSDKRAFLAAQMTKVAYVWDKVSRRVELYNANDWSFPIWVWDDPYHLDQFFPFVAMEFHTDPITAYSKGEVTYYLDQQDDLNLINAQWAKVRRFAAGKFAYNANILKDTSLVEAIIKGTDDTNALPVKLDEGQTLKDAISPLLPPVAEALQLFDKKPVLESIDRMGGVASVQRGVEYKTNTTNRAIESYESQMQTRADEKMDAIEDSVGTVLWLVAQMCLQFMTQDEVASIIGAQHAAEWENMEARQIQQTFTPRVVGGSTLKPTSRAKKEQALQITGVVGQFAGATPVAAAVALKVLAKAFDNVTIAREEWEMIYMSIMQPQGAPAGAEKPPAGGDKGGGQPPPSEGGGQQQQGGAGGAPSIEGIAGIVQEVSRLIDQLPAELKERIGIGLARGQSVEEIAAEVLQMLQGAATQA